MQLDTGFNYAYLYGLSDFWVTLFQDPELNQRLLETTTISAAEVYSRFLQLTSSVSLADISQTIGHDIRLITIDVEGLDGTELEFPLTENFVSAKTLSDRPFLPIKTLEENVDYRLDSGKLIFSKPLLDYGFPYTVTDTGKWRFALWASDCAVDEKLIAKVYAPLVRISPEASTDTYRDFIRGLFFLYTNGPNISYMNRGLSLALGIPLARTAETVLLITRDAQTGQWIVVTDYNAYTLPYSIQPTVTVGQVLALGDGLANVIEMKDYLLEDEWWLNLYIPKTIIPGGATAVPGSEVDVLMQRFLKTHTFLVKINWNPGYEINGFETLLDMVRQSKPSYALGVFAWAVPLGEEEVDVDDEGEGDFYAIPTVYDSEDIGPRGYLYRDDSAPDRRSEAWFIRSNRDPDSIIFRTDVDTEDPTIPLLASQYVVGTGVDEDVAVSDFVPLYNLPESEVITKLGYLGVTMVSPLPNVVGVQGAFYANAVVTTRDEVAVPAANTLAYSETNTTYLDNMFNVEVDGYEPEVYRTYYPNSTSPVKIVFMRMSDDLDVYSAYLVQTSPFLDIDIPSIESLVITMVP